MEYAEIVRANSELRMARRLLNPNRWRLRRLNSIERWEAVTEEFKIFVEETGIVESSPGAGTSTSAATTESPAVNGSGGA